MAEEKLNKPLYKIELWLLKMIPIIITILEIVNTVLSYLKIEVELISAMAGMSLLPWLFFYISSFVFRFCIYHRLFLYYILVNELLSWYDYKIGIPLSDKGYFALHLVVAGLFLIAIVYFKFKLCKNH